jgi:signal transduction histidine kinase/ActR/RegA family two-component response regulator
MAPAPRKSIRHKLTLVMLASGGVATLLVTTVVVVQQLRFARAELRGTLTTAAEVVAAGAAAPLAFEDAQAAAEALATLGAVETVEAAAVFDAEGRAFVTYSRPGPGAAPVPRLAPPRGARWRGEVLELVVPVSAGQDTVGSVWLRASAPGYPRLLASYLPLTAALVLGGVLLVWLTAAVLQRILSEPILALARTAAEVSAQGNYALRAVKRSDDEIGQLVDAFNLMLARIEHRDEELRRYREHLEEQVAARTAELVRVNEELRRAKDAAEEASRLKSQFLANISHDLRTPMNGVIGMTALALRTELDEQQRDYLRTVLDSAESLLCLLNDILDFSKIEAGKLTLEEIPFDVRELVESTVKSLGVDAERKALEVHCRVDPEVPARLVGDPTRFRQILSNLVSNAIKFTERGRVDVEVKLESAAGGEVVVHVTVRDTGIGIPPEKIETIFEPFVQADGSTTRRFGGTGLGLSIASRLAKLMGGRIWVESAVGKGSTFHVVLRLAAPQPDAGRFAAAPAEAGSRRAAGLRILVAEDNPINRKVIAKMLELERHQVTLAGDGSEAVNLVAQESFDLILMDVQMPVMSGLEAARRIRERECATGGHIPIIALTASAMKGDRERCLEAGMDDYLSKPVRPEALSEVIARYAPSANVLPSR